MRARISRRAQVCVAFLLPVGLVKMAPMWMGTGYVAPFEPGTTSAALVYSKPATPWTERQLAAAEHIRAILDESFERTPMANGTTTTDVVEAPIDEAQPLDVELSLILATETGVTALIGGLPYAVGDSIDGWRIEKIDVDKRVVTFRNEKHGDVSVARLPSSTDQP
ncbi:MAG: hypothetical protein ACYTF9_03465 [Planctomycetota bacterium]|jgi:hypothetical protein